MNSHNLFDGHEPSLDYRSVFRYSQMPVDNADNDFENRIIKKSNSFEKFLSGFVICFAYLFVFLTFPISGWFVCKRIKSLERCLVYRLGKRLPLKGPGIVVIMPCIDTFDTIDLNKKDFKVIEFEPMLTSDGSLLDVENYSVSISVSNAIKSFTQLRDAQTNVEQFIRISFKNLITSTHVEDIEKKLDILIFNFVNNCNLYISNWGWTMYSEKLPKITVKIKAEPKNAVVSMLRNYFEPKLSQDTYENPLEDLAKVFFGNPGEYKSAFKEKTEVTPKKVQNDSMIINLEKIAERYAHMNIFNYKLFNIHLVINGESTFYVYSSKEKTAEKVNKIEKDTIHFTVNCKCKEDFQNFVDFNDTSRIEITTKLF